MSRIIKAEERLSALFEALDTLPEGIAVFDDDDRLVYCTDRFREIYGDSDRHFVPGTTFEEITRKSLEGGIVRLNGISADDYVARRMKERQAPSESTEHQLFDGRWIRATDVRTQDGFYIAKRTDVTVEKLAQDSLVDSENRLRAFAESSSDFFWEMDQDLRFSYFSARFTEVTGVAAQTLLGKTRQESGVEGTVDQAVYKRHIDDLAHHRPFRNFIHPREKNDGKIVWLSISGIPVFDRLGSFKGYSGTGQDITESVLANDALRRERNIFTEAMESTTDGFALFDPDDRLVFCNSSFRRLNPELAKTIGAGMTFEDMLRDNVEHGRIVDAVGREEAYIAERMERHRNPSGDEIISERDDGTWILLREQRTPEGSTFLINTDLTVLMERERALETEKLRAEKASKAKSDFLANMSHELRTPLNAIIGFAELLSLVDEPFMRDPSKRLEYAENIREAGHHLLYLINDILDMSKIESGEYALNIAPVSLEHILKSTNELMGPKAEENELALEVSVADNLPEMEGDERAIRQMLLNLLSNAIKFSAPGGRIVSRVEVDTNSIRIVVQDDGIGMSEDFVKVAADPFVQDRTQTFDEPGTGLGLAITKRLADMHRATMKIESEVGKGTTISIDFPRSA